MIFLTLLAIVLAVSAYILCFQVERAAGGGVGFRLAIGVSIPLVAALAFQGFAIANPSVVPVAIPLALLAVIALAIVLVGSVLAFRETRAH